MGAALTGRLSAAASGSCAPRRLGAVRVARHEAMVYWATVFITAKRLTRYETGRAIPPRPASGFTSRL